MILCAREKQNESDGTWGTRDNDEQPGTPGYFVIDPGKPNTARSALFEDLGKTINQSPLP
jgi:hypothetical protein